MSATFNTSSVIVGAEGLVAEPLPSTTLGFNLSEYTELQECAAESAPRSIPHYHPESYDGGVSSESRVLPCRARELGDMNGGLFVLARQIISELVEQEHRSKDV